MDTCLYQMNAAECRFLVSDRIDLVDKCKQPLYQQFKISDMEELTIFLGLKVARDLNGGTLAVFCKSSAWPTVNWSRTL